MPGVFADQLRDRANDPADRRWIHVPYDQLSDQIGPLSREDPESVGIVLVENPWKAARRPYHKQKLALVISNMRHFALEQSERGVAVRHVVARGPYRTALEPIARELGGMRVMEPAERELREDLRPLVHEGLLKVVRHEGWLTTVEQFRNSQRRLPWRMDAFYRAVRKETGILMRDGKPEGGKFSFDVENRKPWKGDPPAPDPPEFLRDPVKEEVAELIETRYRRHPGTVNLDSLPATKVDARRLWKWAKMNCLPSFGPYEDAMSTRSTGLFHTRLSPLLNLHRILPRRVVHEAGRLKQPIASREAFVRQVLGWREFVRHVHVATDGFRDLPSGGSDAAPSFLGAKRPLPSVFWGKERSGLECLDRVVEDVWSSGYGHHITRLMILCNIATLLDVSPRELTDWFWAAYVDAYDWVVEPNVLGMGTFAAGGLMTTKPYVSGSAYINKMSDYCGQCSFDPRKDCPVTPLYWYFLSRNEKRLEGNPRMRLPLSSMRKRSSSQRAADRRVFRKLSRKLSGSKD